jgi:hypothetical protein
MYLCYTVAWIIGVGLRNIMYHKSRVYGACWDKIFSICWPYGGDYIFLPAELSRSNWLHIRSGMFFLV